MTTPTTCKAEAHTRPQASRIMCVGMCVLDIIHVCVEYPPEDSDKRCLDGYWQRGGNASNMCSALRKLGADCEFLGMLSTAEAYGFLREDCRKRGIEIAHCPSTAQDPPFSSVILAQKTATRTIVHSNSNFPILRYDEHFVCIDLLPYAWIHFEARNPSETAAMLRSIHAWNAAHGGREDGGNDTDDSRRRITVSIELEKLCETHIELAAWVDYVFLGKDFAQHLGWQDAKVAVYGLREKLVKLALDKLPAIICAWGSSGACCLDAANKFSQLPASPPAKMVDSLGAGDTFNAATVYALSVKQRNLTDAVAFGNRVAGFKIGHRGYDAIEQFEQ